MTIRTLKDLESILDKEISKLMDISPAYLSDAGKAALEAYKAANWYVGFYEDMKELAADENFMELINISGKHPEYYNVIRKIYRAVERES